MFVRIGNQPRDYAWGSATAIADLLGTRASGGPEAELWLGAHAGSPGRILDPSATGGAGDLATWIARDPGAALGRPAADPAQPRLPYLLKVLAADLPLSLQAHPDSAQAREGFLRENALGIPLDSPERNYKDPWHKPELIYALSPRFEALCGFRMPAVAAEAVGRLHDAGGGAGSLGRFRDRLEAAGGDPAHSEESVLRTSVGWLLGGGADVARLVEDVTAAALALEGSPDRDAETVRVVARAFPSDPGIVIALLMNHLTLTRGDALYLPAGNIHAYLHGLGIELMSASDNVLRGGLTPKHVDVPELLRVVRFTPGPVPLLEPERPSRGVEVFRPGVPDFALTHIALGSGLSEAGISLPGPAIVLCTAGSFSVAGRHSTSLLSRGEAAYATPDEGALSFTGAGTIFVATPDAPARAAEGAAR